MGDVIALSDSDGNVFAEYTYDAWGSLQTINTADENNAEQLAIANANPLRYRGYYYDNETGYYYLQSRYYDASICRFINADDYNYIDKDTKTGLNILVYCANNPVNYLDKSGYEKWSVGKSSYGSAITVEIKLYAGKALSTRAYFTYNAYSNRIVVFDNRTNYAKKVALNIYFDEMADAIYSIVKSIHNSSLKGRTKKGIAVELAIHYYLYKMKYKTLHTKTTEIGGTNNDYNAKDFERIAKIPNTFSNILKGVKSTINKYKSKV